MIPHYLSLTNFLSYRDTAALDLSGVHLACISGLNGAGKSSLLDGITWALFGRGRSGDDNVVNRIAAGNGKAAEVTFIFELEGAIYRVIRRKTVGKTTQLELHVRGEEGGQPRWRTLTQSGVRETQRAIEELLRMQYDIFTNASFLLQGQADEFTTKTPNRRKEILADILGVNRWDAYKALAGERRKAAENEEKVIDRRLADIDAELAQEGERRRELEVAETYEQAVAIQQAAQDTLVATLREKRALIEPQRQQLARMVAELERTQAEVRRLAGDIAPRRAELDSQRALIERAPAITAAHAAYQQSAAELATWQKRADEANALLRERQPFELAIAKARTALEERVQTLAVQEAAAAGDLADRQRIAGELTEHRDRLAAVEVELTALGEQQVAWQAARDRLKTAEGDSALWQLEHDQLAAQAEEAERGRAQREMIADSHAQAQRRLDAAQDILTTLAAHEERRIDMARERAQLNGELDALRRAGEERNERIERLRVDESTGECPICGQPLTEEHRASVLKDLEDEREASRARYREVQARLQALDKDEAMISAETKRRPQHEKERDTQQRSLANYAGQLAHIDERLSSWTSSRGRDRLTELGALLASTDVAALRAEEARLRPVAEDLRQKTRAQQLLMADIRGLETRCEQLDKAAQQWAQTGRPALLAARRDLAEERYAADAQARLAAVNERLAAVGYDADAHAATRNRLAEQSAAPEEYQALQRAEATIKALADGLAELERRREEQAERAADLEAQHASLSALLRDAQTGVTDLRAAEAELARLRDEQARAIRATSAARQKVEVLADLRRVQKDMRAERQAVGGRIGLLRQLEDACGRNGVQALLIETALPEIEEHANELLYRLSGGEMRVRFDTQRDRKSDGGQIETLDIKISDNSGERPYENYSGGEKFRVNFAIRLALSQVLARRAGARLQTLVIDEGFGSQDPEGRQRLVEAINAVQPEFACILVITHIDELRDKFPARIEVEKTPAGSRLELVSV